MTTGTLACASVLTGWAKRCDGLNAVARHLPRWRRDAAINYEGEFRAVVAQSMFEFDQHEGSLSRRLQSKGTSNRGAVHRFFFNEESGLMVRRTDEIQEPLGNVPEQYDFSKFLGLPRHVCSCQSGASRSVGRPSRSCYPAGHACSRLLFARS
jgi:hypothetical protein